MTQRSVPRLIAPAEDPHSVLGVARDATAEEVRRAYFQLVRKYPPETHPEEFKRVRTAYDTLRSPIRRAELAVLSFDESAAEVDLELVADLAAAADVDLSEVLLALELSVSELARTTFPEDLTPIVVENLFESR